MGKYRLFATVRMDLGNGRVLVHSRWTGETRVLSQSEAQQLLSCQDFKSLPEHATDHVRQTRRQQLKSRARTSSVRGLLARWTLRFMDQTGMEMPVPEGEVAQVEEGLRELAEAGVLVSDSELQSALRDAGPENGTQESVPPISSLAIPTKNRPALLKRALSSHAEELVRRGREVEIVVLDDSDNEDARRQNRAVVGRMKERYGLQVRYADRERRAAYAARLAEVSGTDPEITHFALVGDPKYATHGGPRNAHLLDSVDRLCLQVDDDVIGGVETIPERQPGLALGSAGGNAHQLWFFPGEEMAFDFPEPAETDLLSAHEEMLGQSVASSAARAMEQEEPVNLDQMSSALLRDVERAGARVALSIAGTSGDSAMPNHLDARLLQKGESFERVVGNGEEEYRNNLRTRYLVRSPRRRRVLDRSFLMSGIIGVDCRDTIPPFMVPGRNMDGTFRSVVNRHLGPYRIGYVPYVFRHAPPEPRDAAERSEVVHPQKIRLNDLLILLIRSKSSEPSSSSVDRSIERLGTYLVDVAQTGQDRFNGFVRERVLQKTASRIQFAERRLEEEDETPVYWARDLRTLIKNYEEHITGDFFFAPTDLEGTPQKRMATLKSLVGTYGRLLQQWPAMVEGARTLRAEGERVSQPVWTSGSP